MRFLNLFLEQAACAVHGQKLYQAKNVGAEVTFLKTWIFSWKITICLQKKLKCPYCFGQNWLDASKASPMTLYWPIFIFLKTFPVPSKTFFFFSFNPKQSPWRERFGLYGKIILCTSQFRTWLSLICLQFGSTVAHYRCNTTNQDQAVWLISQIADHDLCKAFFLNMRGDQ